MTTDGILDLRLLSSVSDSLSDRTANWFGDAKNEVARISEVGPFCVSAPVQGENLACKAHVDSKIV
jgi:hypothetical protein